jgi:hypothetical protein
MKMQAKQNCPLNGFNACVELQCAWFTKMQGANPNTGETIEEWGCAIAWLPMLMVENAMQARQVGAAVESFRNEMVTANRDNVALGAAAMIARQLKKE